MTKIKFVVAVFFTCWFAWWFFHPINLHYADLGRHIMNGKIILENPAEALSILHTNYYTYTTPNAPFINHHWLTGIVFYLIYKFSGFAGLGIFSLLINTAAFALLYRLGIKRAGFFPTTIIAAAFIPLIAERTEIRPEMFSYLFTALFLTILSGVFEGRTNKKQLLWLIPLQLLWVNLHIYFFLGFVYIGLYFVAAHFQKNKLRNQFLFTGLGAAFAGLINPSFVNGLLYPLFIFTNYGIKTFENQSIYELDVLGKTPPNFVLMQIATAVGMLVFSHLALRKPKELCLPDCVLFFLTAIWAFAAIRNLTIFGYMTLFALPSALKNAAAKINDLAAPRTQAICLVILFTASSALSYSRLEDLAPHTGFGLVERNTGVADFIRQNNLSGPMFNDFDIGSYATFFFYPHIKPFIDNRPEAFPEKFLADIYNPMLTNELVWETESQKYNFNFILHHFNKTKTVSGDFIINRLHDPAWSPVFADEFAILFLKNSPQNTELISKYKIPISQFKL